MDTMHERFVATASELLDQDPRARRPLHSYGDIDQHTAAQGLDADALRTRITRFLE